MFNLFKKKSPEELIAEANLPSNYRILQLEDGRYIWSEDHGRSQAFWIDYESSATKDLKNLLAWVAYKIKKQAEKAAINAKTRKVIGGGN